MAKQFSVLDGRAVEEESGPVALGRYGSGADSGTVREVTAAAKIADPRVMTVEVADDEIIAHLVDGRTISVSLVWSWRLANATEKQRQDWEILGDGEGVRWPDIDEDLSVEGMLYGTPAHRPRIPAGRVT